MRRPTQLLNSEAVTCIEVAGAPRERGRQYGEQARDFIARSVDYYTELFGRTHGITWDTVAERALVWQRPVERFDADIWDELQGVAEGAGRSIGELLALNARGEMVYGNYLAELPDGCTSYAVLPTAAADGHLYAGQNWDWRFAARDTWIVLRIVQAGKPTVITVVEAGQLARHGVNSAGIGVFANGLGGFCTQEPRVPLPIIRRRALESELIADCLQCLLDTPAQIACNVVIVHRDGFALDIEITPDRCALLYPDNGILVHGNHYEGFTWAADGETYKPFGADSIYRVYRLREALRQCRDPDGDVTAVVTEALQDHFGYPDAICNHPRATVDRVLQWQTLCSSVVDFTTGEVRMAAGTPCSQAYERLPWNMYDAE